MKSKLLLAICSLQLCLCASTSRALVVTATGSGNWDSAAVGAPWPGGTVPSPIDDVVIPATLTVTVVAPATIRHLTISGTCQNDNTLTVTGNLSGSGSLNQGAGATLNIGGNSSGIATLNAIATDNTVNYTGNAGGGVKLTTYNNLIFSGSGTFFNSSVVAINSNLTLSGSTKVQQGAAITIGGDLTIGTGTQYDPSCNPMTVTGATMVSGILVDLCGGGGLANSLNHVLVLSGGQWKLTDVTQWSVNGNFSNEGTLSGTSGRITFVGSGTLSGSAGISLPNLTVSGTYTIGTTVTVANNPILSGTLNMDIGQSYRIVRPSGTLTYGGNLFMVNSGAPPANGNTYQLFSATSYNGSFTSINFPPLGSGLSWVNNLLVSGSIAASDGAGGPPTLSTSVSGGQLTLTWDTTTFPGYHLQGQTNSAGVGGSWNDVPGGNASPFVLTLDNNNPPAFFRLKKP